MLSLPLVGIIWQLMYARNEGFVNNLLGTAGTPGAVDWFGDSNVNLWAALVAATWRHAGYIMVLYLAGLKGVDPSLREAAAIDGASATQTFFRVVFPAMRPINIVVVVITIIEALRAFDIVYIINRGDERARADLRADRAEPGRRGAGDRRRVGTGGHAAAGLPDPDHHLPLPHVQQRRTDMASAVRRDRRRRPVRPTTAPPGPRRRKRGTPAPTCCCSPSR